MWAVTIKQGGRLTVVGKGALGPIVGLAVGAEVDLRAEEGGEGGEEAVGPPPCCCMLLHATCARSARCRPMAGQQDLGAAPMRADPPHALWTGQAAGSGPQRARSRARRRCAESALSLCEGGVPLRARRARATPHLEPRDSELLGAVLGLVEVAVAGGGLVGGTTCCGGYLGDLIQLAPPCPRPLVWPPIPAPALTCARRRSTARLPRLSRSSLSAPASRRTLSTSSSASGRPMHAKWRGLALSSLEIAFTSSPRARRQRTAGTDPCQEAICSSVRLDVAVETPAGLHWNQVSVLLALLRCSSACTRERDAGEGRPSTTASSDGPDLLIRDAYSYIWRRETNDNQVKTVPNQVRIPSRMGSVASVGEPAGGAPARRHL
jgi:hypothetical protein